MTRKISDEEKLEYQTAQASAEHYNSMIWKLISIGIITSVYILYEVLTKEQDILVEILMLLGGTLLLFYFSYLIEGSNEKKNLKYIICQKIESKHKKKFFGQNLLTEELKISSAKNGMYILRGIKGVLFLIYLMFIIEHLLIAFFTSDGTGVPIILSIIGVISLLFIIGSIMMEIYYLSVKNNFEELLAK